MGLGGEGYLLDTLVDAVIDYLIDRVASFFRPRTLRRPLCTRGSVRLHMGRCVDMCVDLRVDMCADMTGRRALETAHRRMGMCVNMCMDICVDMTGRDAIERGMPEYEHVRKGMCVEIHVGVWAGMRIALWACGQACGQACR